MSLNVSEFNERQRLVRQVIDLKRNIQTTVNVLRQVASDEAQTAESISSTIHSLADDLETVCLK